LFILRLLRRDLVVRFVAFADSLAGYPERLPRKAHQYLYIIHGQCSARKDSSQPEHHVICLVRFHETHVEHGFAPHCEHTLSQMRRRFRRFLQRRFVNAAGNEDFVAADHHSLGDVER